MQTFNQISLKFTKSKTFILFSFLATLMLFSASTANAGNNHFQADPEDFGDLPAPYPYSAHYITTVRLGSAIDAEAANQPDSNAGMSFALPAGDDGNGVDDEDGITFLTPIQAGQTAKIEVSVTGTNGYLTAWMDFDGDGNLDSIVQDLTIDGVPASTIYDQFLTVGVHTITFTAPNNANATAMYSRWRITESPGQVTFPGGKALTGEVEDYVLMSMGNLVFSDDGCGAGTLNDGVRNGCESGVPNVLVELMSSNCIVPMVDGSNQPITTTTDANGNYLFTGLTDGDYCVRVAASNFQSGGALAGSFSSDGAGNPNDNTDNDDNGQGGQGDDPTVNGVVSGSVSVAVGTEPGVGSDGNGTNSNLTIDFGFANTSQVCIGDIVWNDQDGDTINFGEPGISGVTVLLYNAGSTAGDGSEVATTTTDPMGIYHFCGIAPGSYFVAFDLNSPSLAIFTGTSTGGNHHPDNTGDDFNISGDDCTNGPAGYVVTQALNATVNGQLDTSDVRDAAGYADASSYMTVDCGFVPPTATAVTYQTANVNPLQQGNAGIIGSFVTLALLTLWALRREVHRTL